MRQMRWSWEELQETPTYVRRYCLDFLVMVNEQQDRDMERERRKAKREAGG